MIKTLKKGFLKCYSINSIASLCNNRINMERPFERKKVELKPAYTGNK
jgi:hypothetical protein